MKTCKVNNCSNKHYAKGYCNNHYMQVRNHGDVLQRTVYNKNDYEFEKDICKIVLRSKNQEIIDHAIIDAEDYKLVKKHKWHLTTRGYVECSTRKGKVKLCNLVFPKKITKGYEVDHKYNNPLDNRKKKLRLCTHKQNSQNKKLQKNNSTGMIGVSFNKTRNKYIAQLKTDNLRVLFKRFNNPLDAMIERDNCALEYFGEFAKTNKSLGLY